MRSAAVQRSARRLSLARILVAATFTLLGLRAAHLSLLDGRGAERGDAQTRRTWTLPPQRGAILDRERSELALSVQASSVYAIASQIDDVPETARALSKALNLDRRGLQSRLSGRPGFQFLARWVTPERAARIRQLDLDGIGVIEEPRRTYPHDTLAAQVIGFANIDGVGVRGIEQQEESWLRGRTQRIPVERDGGGNVLLASNDTSWRTAGGDVALTLDATLQAAAEQALDQAVRRSGARGGIVVSLDARSGEVYVAAEAPTFNPNRFRELDYASTRSRAYLDAVEPGSILKIFTVAAALETGALTPDTRIDCERGSLRLPGKTIHDTHPHDLLDLAGILRVSSNIGAVKVAQALGPSAHHEMLRRFGFGHPTAGGFPDESAGLLRPWRSWRAVDHATIAFGQGVSVTPIQLTAAVAALANGGEWVRPRLVAARRSPSGSWRPTNREVVRRVTSPQTARAVLTMLEGVTGPDGTGTRAALAGVRVAGKTGTAQKFDTEQGRYASDRFRAWFIGVIPAENPQFVILAGLDEPKRPHHTGGAVAAPLFARIAEAHVERLGIPRDSELPGTAIATTPRPAAPAPSPPAPVAAASPPVEASPEPPVTSPSSVARYRDLVLVPDFLGLTPEEVTHVTEGSGIAVRLSGQGRAVAQDPPPGSVLATGEAMVRVEFAPARENERRG